MPHSPLPRHARASPSARARLTSAAERDGSRLAAEAGTWRGWLWCCLIALVFVGISHPKIIQSHMPTVVLWMLIAAAVVAVVDFRNVRMPRAPRLIVVFLAYCLLTMVWSADPSATLYAVLYYAAMAFLALVLVANISGRLFVRGMSCGAVLVMALSLGAVVLGHPNALGPSGSLTVFQGLYGNRNIMAYVMTFGMVALLADRFQSRLGELFRWSMVAAGLVTMYFVHSGTGTVVVAVLLVLALALALLSRLAPAVRGWVTKGFLLAGALVAVVAVASFSQLTAALGKDGATFSGRLPLWRGIIDVWSERPFGGYGWGAVWAYAWYEIDESPVWRAVNESVGFPLNHGHNAVLDVLIQVGIIGTVIYVVVVFGTLARAFVRRDVGQDAASRWVVLASAALIAGGVSEPLFSAPIGWFHTVTAAALISVPREAAGTGRTGWHRRPR